MTHDRDFFTPNNVDDQVERICQASQEDDVSSAEQAEETAQMERHLIKDLQAYYQIERQQDSASLERAWKRISLSPLEKRQHAPSTSQPLSANMLRFPQERTRMRQSPVPEKTTRGKFAQRLGLLAAVLVTALLVGGLAAVLRLSHQANTLGSRLKRTPTPTNTPVPVGTTVYTTPPDQYGFDSLVWSPDSKRIAALGGAEAGVQIWDATTGGHFVQVQFPGSNEWGYSLAWSPSQEVAVGTNQHLLILDGQTGKILHTYAENVPIVFNGTSSGNDGFLSSRLLASGGFGYRAVAWSPDGHFVAATLSSGVSGEAQVWDVQTGTVASTLQVGGSNNIGALAWSSDGAFLAATTWNTQAPDPTQPTDMAIVWQVSTHQIVFRHQDELMGSGTSIVWQPGSHNLAFTGTTISGSERLVTLKIWDAITGKEVRRFVRMGSQALVWSPDGQDLAYAGGVQEEKTFLPAVIIIDATTGKQIYAYTADSKGYMMSNALLAWSPNGRYVVSIEYLPPSRDQTSPSEAVANVWIA